MQEFVTKEYSSSLKHNTLQSKTDFVSLTFVCLSQCHYLKLYFFSFA